MTTFTKEQFIAFRDTFKCLANAKTITSADILLYNIFRGVAIDRGFTPITNPVKLICQVSDEGIRTAKNALHWNLKYRKPVLRARFGDLFTDEFQTELLTKI